MSRSAWSAFAGIIPQQRIPTGLLPLIEEHGPPSGLLAKEGSSFAALARSIIGQQLATKAAAVIFQRTLEACQVRLGEPCLEVQ